MNLNYDTGVMIFYSYMGSLYDKDVNFYMIAHFGPSLYAFQLHIVFLII